MKRRSEEVSRQARLMDDMRQARCIREMAFMLVLVHTGTEFDNDTIDTVCDNVAMVRAEYGASPDHIQAALELNEPSLALGVMK